jgi:hypothetical protein
MLRVILLATIVTLGLSSAFAGTVSGKLTVNEKTIPLQHIYGLQVPDWTDKDQTAVRLLVTDKPIPGNELTKNLNTFDLRDAGISGIQFEFFSGGTNYSMVLVGSAVDGSVSTSGTFDNKAFTNYSTAHVAGTLRDAREFGNTKFQYDLRFDTEVAPMKVDAPPTAQDIAAAQKAESAKAYLGFHKAVQNEDIPDIKASVIPERAKMMDSPEFREQLALVRELMPKSIQVMKATENGDEATLVVESKDDGDSQVGTISLRKINGRWLVGKESWTSK